MTAVTLSEARPARLRVDGRLGQFALLVPALALVAIFFALPARFHAMVEDLAAHLERGHPLEGTTPARLLQGPFADAMTHAGQLALLRRLAGSPVPPENFIVASIDPGNLGPEQPRPVSPDRSWPEAPPGWRPAHE